MVVASSDVRLPRLLRRDAGTEVDRLYRRHADEVLRYALLVLRSRPDAEDVTQIVFVRALRAIERGERVRTPRNWLIKIAHNECRRLLANRKVHAALPDEIAVEPAEPGRAEELRAALAALPEHQRQALVLRELEGRPYVEIAKALNLSVAAVETLIFRARRAVREQIENAMTCEEFVALLDDPAARSRVRAHARVCPECATLDHQSRGRKSALKRIASAFGLPWWGAKLAAVALTTATVAAVAMPHDGTRPTPADVKLNLIPPSSQLSPVAHRGGTRFKSSNPKPKTARPVVAAPKHVSDTTAVVSGIAAPRVRPAALTPEPPLPGPADPPEPPSPADVPVAPASPASAVPLPAASPVPVKIQTPPVAVPAVTTPPVTVPSIALPPVQTPAVTVPAVTVPAIPQLPSVPVPVEIPKVSLP